MRSLSHLGRLGLDDEAGTHLRGQHHVPVEVDEVEDVEAIAHPVLQVAHLPILASHSPNTMNLPNSKLTPNSKLQTPNSRSPEQIVISAPEQKPSPETPHATTRLTKTDRTERIQGRFTQDLCEWGGEPPQWISSHHANPLSSSQKSR
ncbi:hypothetical protein M758_12G056500 [Ceratodon purpureus]|nr:hypothetical protein M758_12G056500 [Ceratodon purpureus]